MRKLMILWQVHPLLILKFTSSLRVKSSKQEYNKSVNMHGKKDKENWHNKKQKMQMQTKMER